MKTTFVKFINLPTKIIKILANKQIRTILFIWYLSLPTYCATSLSLPSVMVTDNDIDAYKLPCPQ